MSAKTSLRSLAFIVATFTAHAVGIEAEFKDDRFSGMQMILARSPQGEIDKLRVSTCLIAVMELQNPKVTISFSYRGKLSWSEGAGKAFWIVDGERLSQDIYQGIMDGTNPLDREHSALIHLDASTCSKILAAKSVEMKIGTLEAVVTKEILEPVQAVVDRYRAELAKGTLRERPAK